MLWNWSLLTEELLQPSCDKVVFLMKQISLEESGNSWAQDIKTLCSSLFSLFYPLPYVFLRSVTMWWVERNTTSLAFPSSVLSSCTQRALLSCFSLPVSHLYELLCWGCSSAAELELMWARASVSMKSCFQLKWEQCWLYWSYILWSTFEDVSASFLS